LFGGLSDRAPSRLRASGCRLWFPEVRTRPARPVELQQVLPDANIVIAGLEPWTDGLMAAAPLLRLICRFGVGVDTVDIAAATRRGVLVASTPGVNHTAVAEHTIALLLALMRRVTAQDARAKRGEWAPEPGPELRGRILGVVGLGLIGRQVADLALAFGMRVIAAEIQPDPAFVVSRGIEIAGLADMLARADVVSLHVPLSDDTRGMIDAAALNSMKRGAYLVNTSRGGLVDEAALHAALTSGQLAGAALDVTDPEPPSEWRLAQLPQVVLTPHVAGLSVDAIARMESSAIETTLAVLRGEQPATVLNPGAVSSRPR
jgi:phosphoglycerate dehydrogenase-like enzyme